MESPTPSAACPKASWEAPTTTREETIPLVLNARYRAFLHGYDRSASRGILMSLLPQVASGATRDVESAVVNPQADSRLQEQFPVETDAVHRPVDGGVQLPIPGDAPVAPKRASLASDGSEEEPSEGTGERTGTRVGFSFPVGLGISSGVSWWPGGDSNPRTWVKPSPFLLVNGQYGFGLFRLVGGFSSSPLILLRTIVDVEEGPVLMADTGIVMATDEANAGLVLSMPVFEGGIRSIALQVGYLPWENKKKRRHGLGARVSLYQYYTLSTVYSLYYQVDLVRSE